MSNKRTTAELATIPCVCGKGVITASVSEIRAGVWSGRVESQVGSCPACGSTDINAARAAKAAREQKKPT